MDITLLVQSFVGLISLLAVLIFFLFYSPAQKRKKIREENEKKQRAKSQALQSFESLIDIIRDKKSTSEELKKALSTILEEYGEIDNFSPYGEILIRICRHPNTTKDIILDFNRSLEKRNPNYDREINGSIAQGLNSR